MCQKLLNVANGSGAGSPTAIAELIPLAKLNFQMGNITRLQALPLNQPPPPLSPNICRSIPEILDSFRVLLWQSVSRPLSKMAYNTPQHSMAASRTSQGAKMPSMRVSTAMFMQRPRKQSLELPGVTLHMVGPQSPQSLPQQNKKFQNPVLSEHHR
jgi:hypothetical protein